jgi:energy-coupling factor transporter ATP-binding protein EcfA2
MAIKIKSTKNITANGANIVIYGESGVGKTKLLDTLEDLFILSADEGLLTISDSDIEYVEITCMQDVDDAYNHIIKNKGKYQNVAFDSLTEMAEVVLYEMKEGKKDKRQAYGELADAFGVMIRKFRDIHGINTIFIAKRKHIKNDEGEVIAYEPMMPGQVLPHGLPYLTDEVFAYTMDRKGNRCIQTSADRRYPAKDRSNRLEAKELNPNLQEIINRVLNKEPN